MGAVAGLCCGLVAAAPLALLLRGSNPNMGHGLAAVAFAFLLVQGAMFAVHAFCPAELVSFGSLATLSFLMLVVAAVVRRELRR